jgi:hypothetical protein
MPPDRVPSRARSWAKPHALIAALSRTVRSWLKHCQTWNGGAQIAAKALSGARPVRP